MPPTQPFVSSKISGYVCRACLSQLRRPQRPRTPWLVRYATDGPSRARRPKKTEEPPIKYFEQTPDGERVEDVDNPAEISILRDVEEQIRLLEEEGSDQGDYLVGDDEPSPVELLSHIGKQYKVPETMRSAMGEMVSQMADASNLESMSQEERDKLRHRLLNFEAALRPTSDTPEESLQEHVPHEVSTSTAPDVTPIVNLSTSTVVNPARYPEAFRRRIVSLNNALRQASQQIQEGQKPTPEVQKQMWKAYLLCRNVLLSEPADVPFGVWSTLWKVFSDEQKSNLDRMAHINYLGGDMLRAGAPLDPTQQLLYIEACFVEKDHKAALDMWERARGSFDNDPDGFREYLRLGIQMFCHNGQVRQALQTTSFLLNTSHDNADGRMLLHIIQACVKLPTAAEKKIAWALYIRLRAILGAEMTMEDYDAVTSIFLAANQPDLALGAFKDMMLTGSSHEAEQDSTALYQRATGVEGGLDLATINGAELNWEDSRTLAALPPQFNNKFFFGKWIKKLIGDHELDAAKKVLDLMVARGIHPDAKYMNGLIGALYRTGTAGEQALAEDLAWRMIAERIKFVEQRAMQSSLKAPLRAVKVDGREGHRSILLTPKATIETFSILVQQYRRRQKQDRLVDLFRTLNRAQIPPNTIFMNQLIMVDTKSHQSQWAWDTYHSLVDNHGVTPDFETFEFLWHLMKKATDPVSKGSHRSFATPRALFAEMVRWAPVLNRGDRMPRDLYDEVILCFSLAEDQVGTAVALRALQQRFGLFPNEQTVRTVVLQLARLRLRNAAGSRPRRLQMNRDTKARIEQVTEILAAFKNQRTEELRENGIEFEELPEEAKLEESLLLLSHLLQHVYRAKMAGLEAPVASEMSRMAAEQMGVPDSDPWSEPV